MGKTASKDLNIQEIDFSQWQNVGFHRQTVEIVKSIRGKGEAQVQNVPLDPKRNLQKQLQIYQYRKDQGNALVHSYGVEANQHKVSNICGNQKIIKVITERIPKRLTDLPQLTFQESLYTLSQCFRGYKDCYTKLGPFQVTQQMIGVNPNGQIRVWVNEDFGQNHPSLQKPVLQTTSSSRNNHFQQLTGNKDQGQMVRNIIEKVQQKCEAGRYPAQFRQRIFKNSYSFDDSYRQIQRFSLQKNLFIPQRIMLDRPFKSKQQFFTPGDKYVRNINDPNFRNQRQALYSKPTQNWSNSKPVQNLSMTRQTFPVTDRYNSGSYRQSNQSPYIYNYGNQVAFNSSNRISSPINIINRQSRQMPLQYNKVVFQSQPVVYRQN